MSDVQLADLKKMLEEELSGIEDPDARIDKWNRFIHHCLSKNPQHAKTLALELLEELKTYPDDYIGAAYARCHLAIAMRLNSELGDALKLHVQNLPLFEKQENHRMTTITFMEMGAIMIELGEYPDAMKYNLKALDMIERFNNPLLKCQTLTTLGNLYSKTKQHEKAVETYKAAQNLLRECEPDSRDYHTYLYLQNNLAAEYLDTGDYNRCIKMSNEALDGLKTKPDPRLESALLSNIARAWLESGKPEKALPIITQCLSLADEIGAGKLKVGALIVLGRILRVQGKTEAALEKLKEGCNLATELGIKERVANCYELISDIYKSIGNFEKALNAHVLFHKAKERIINAEALRKVRALNILHEVESTKKRIEVMTKANKQLKEEIARRQKVEQELRTNEERFRLAKQAGKTGIWDLDILTGSFYIDPEIIHMLGYKESEIPDNIKEFRHLVHSDDRKLVIRKAMEHISGRTPMYEIEHRIIDKSGAVRWVFATGKVIRDHNGTPIRMLGTGSDITDRKFIETKYHETSARLEAIFKSARDIIFMKDPSGNYTLINSAINNLLEKDIAGKLPFRDEDLFDSETAKIQQRSDKLVLNGETVESEMAKKMQDREFVFHTVKTPVRDPSGKIIGICGIARDVTDKKRMEQKMTSIMAALTQKTEKLEKFSKAVEYSANIIVITDRNGTIEYVNPRFTQVTGYSSSEAIGQNPRILKSNYPYPDKNFYSDLWKTILSGKAWRGEFRNKKKDGTVYWEEANIAPIRNESNEITHFIAVKEDITERIASQNALKKSLAEKELLLKEVHHRVKNNLAIISSLLDLQASGIPEIPIKEKFQECQSRIHTMALVHRNLYESDDLGKVDFKQYIDNLTGEIKLIHGPKADFIFDLDNIFFTIDQAIPLGLILNELITNSFKHAFTNGICGTITIRLKHEGDTLQLTVMDNGIGFPPDMDIEDLDSLGMQLVASLTEQIGGTLEWSGENGAEFHISFPVEDERF